MEYNHRDNYNNNDNYQDNTYDNVDTSLYILNEKNVLITKNYINDILKRYGVNHNVKNVATFQRAMIHTSYLIRDEEYWKTHRSKNTNKDLEPIDDPSKAEIQLQTESYERLEFLGDSVIHLILAEYFFKRYENQAEGFMTRLRTKIENGDTLAYLTKSIGLDKYIVLSRYIEVNEGRSNNASILEDAFEAFMGALFLDGGFEPCKSFMTKLMEDKIDFAQLLHKETNFKDMLLQYFHQRGWLDPKYGQLDVSGPDHKKIFTMYVKRKKTQTDDGDIVGMGMGTSKKKGEQKAAFEALKFYQVIKNDDDEDSDTCEEYSSFDDSDEEFDTIDEIDTIDTIDTIDEIYSEK